MRILVVGAGAVGGLFGGQLAAHGRDVTFLVRPARAEALRTAGLQLIGTAGGPQQPIRTIPVTALTVDDLPAAGPFDIVLLAVKAYGLDRAVADIAPAMDGGAAVLPVLNGMRHLDVLADRFGAEQVIGGFAFVSSYLDGNGRISTGPVPAALTYGELDGTVTDRISRLHAVVDGCGFQATLSRTIRADLWAKWVYLAAFAALNVLTGGSVGQASRAPGGRETARALLAESAAVAQAGGHRPPPDKLARDLAFLTATDSDNRASMDKDRLAGRPVESEAIIGDMVDRAIAGGVQVPLLQATRAALGVYQASRSASATST
jgi:2-dehydropantoate 2-reductase